MKKQLVVLLGVTLLSTACHRTGREAWEDTKTCSRYVGQGFRTLFGNHSEGNEYVSYNNWYEDAEYDPMIADNESYSPLEMDDFTPPISKESPGDPGSPIPGVEGFSTPQGALATLFANIHFDTDNYSIKGDDNYHYLHEIANYLTKNPSLFVFVEGHADERGAAAYNLALGSRRSNSVRTFLIQNGVSPDQLFTISYGKERPFVEGHDSTTWEQNRRAQFKTYER
ncbi:MAG: Peptidoglycan-associated lipoprotein [Chlamydiales bacterium]|nr:Peptidoglycan-associated lipoprotein [Chlamydiales bacterium]MCH9619454.1 Peptidoglycan-associated lipoprotein [Chlamydiales bacterium]MCH9622258.1 Peptidoglycan-associated lipoprotein [Chlamydiales bacterium]